MKCALLLLALGLFCVLGMSLAADMKCHSCNYKEKDDSDSKDDSKERDKCDDSKEDEPCDDDDSVCVTRARNVGGKLHVFKGCMKKDTCKKEEDDNDDDCDDDEVESGKTCHYCCKGNHCNRKTSFKIVSGASTVIFSAVTMVATVAVQLL